MLAERKQAKAEDWLINSSGDCVCRYHFQRVVQKKASQAGYTERHDSEKFLKPLLSDFLWLRQRTSGLCETSEFGKMHILSHYVEKTGFEAGIWLLLAVASSVLGEDPWTEPVSLLATIRRATDKSFLAPINPIQIAQAVAQENAHPVQLLLILPASDWLPTAVSMPSQLLRRATYRGGRVLA
ncbi:uncharacterized protein TRIREDRAFT_111811 [Trichoderma reesei QM6a]|uniref:Predicted protein n=1 Tax=Hypocrea jecorina (strain QM6a) TaxID=431241 RepID=G0RVH2_HYPJQ|nr:uncharacterized protein TRIREDRAFT_111811 [Trichoderma reesei QM6a]EGR44802.1 predicted protein [Trichoderma reesei QM6a]